VGPAGGGNRHLIPLEGCGAGQPVAYQALVNPSRIVLVESESGTDQRKIWPLCDGSATGGGPAIDL
jgi:hypothetical protein